MKKKTKQKKYWLLKIEITCGEYEFISTGLHEGDFDAEEYVKNFYDGLDEGDEGCGTYYFNGGEIACSVYSLDELTKKEFNILRKFI